ILSSQTVLPHRSAAISQSCWPAGTFCFLTPTITRPSLVMTGEETTSQLRVDDQQISPAGLTAYSGPVSAATTMVPSSAIEPVASPSLPAALRRQSSFPAPEMEYRQPSWSPT